MSSKATYFPALTGVRAIAAYLVFLIHLNPFDPETPYAFPNLPGGEFGIWLKYFTNQGGVGVPIFFVLSGFLITIRYIDSIKLTWTWWRRYITNRFARIYPLYFLTTVITLSLNNYGSSIFAQWQWKAYSITDKLVAIGLNITLLRTFFDEFKLIGVGQAWTLTCEELFYFSAPFLLITLHYKPFRLLLYPFSVIFFGFFLVWVSNSVHVPYRFMDNVHFMLNWTYFGHVFSFSYGIFLALVIRKTNIATRKGISYTTTGILFSMLCLLIITKLEIPYPLSDIGVNPVSASIIFNFITPIGIAIFFFGIITEKSKLRSLLETKIFDLLGKSSYAFYLIHVGFFNTFISVYISDNIFIHFILTILFSIVLFRFIEEPVHRRIRSIQQGT